jgi:hypothetical protein
LLIVGGDEVEVAIAIEVPQNHITGVVQTRAEILMGSKGRILSVNERRMEPVGKK